MKKKLFAWILAAVMLLTLLPATALAKTVEKTTKVYLHFEKWDTGWGNTREKTPVKLFKLPEGTETAQKTTILEAAENVESGNQYAIVSTTYGDGGPCRFMHADNGTYAAKTGHCSANGMTSNAIYTAETVSNDGGNTNDATGSEHMFVFTDKDNDGLYSIKSVYSGKYVHPIITSDAHTQLSLTSAENEAFRVEKDTDHTGKGLYYITWDITTTTTVTDHNDNKPDPGTTYGQPFEKETATSRSFRIPGLEALDNGTLFAFADARWNTTYDGGGLDTIGSISPDGFGSTWNYSFINYLGDNGNTYNGGNSTCFIDPSVVSDGDTIYLACDLYPYGVALNGNGGKVDPVKLSGFDGSKLLLTDSSSPSSYTGGYNYYLDMNSDPYVIRSKSTDEAQTGYTVDKWFNVEEPDGKLTNLFFSNSHFKVARTSYLYFVKSTDAGATWSAPTLIPLKEASERAYLVSPSKGLITSKGDIIFPCYSFGNASYSSDNTNSQRMSFIYSTDGGENWKRSAPMTNTSNGATWSSESVAVELTDGTLRFFFRTVTSRLTYVDYTYSDNLESGSWSTPVKTDIKTNSNCQMSAFTYSKTVDGKQIIILSAPTGPNEGGSNSSTGGPYSADGARLNGKIFVLSVNDDSTRSISVVTKYDVSGLSYADNDEFMYSAVTELKDGRVGILYEDHQNSWGTSDITYYTMEFKTFTLDGVDFDEPEPPAPDDPTEEDLDGFQVTVRCQNQFDTSVARTYGVLPGGVTVGAAVKGDSGYTADVTVHTDVYVREFDKDTKITHTLERPGDVTVTLAYTEEGGWAISSQMPVTLDVLCETMPEGPTEDDLTDLSVKVTCGNRFDGISETYGLLEGGVRIGAVTKSGDSYTAEVTVLVNTYLAQFNADHEDAAHNLTDTRDAKVTLTYSDGWTITGGDPVTLTVTCETLPDGPSAENVAGLVGPITVHDNGYVEHEEGTYTLQPADIQVQPVHKTETGYEATAILSLNGLLTAYNETSGTEHTLEEDTEIQIALTLGLENDEWVLASEIPTVSVTCPAPPAPPVIPPVTPVTPATPPTDIEDPDVPLAGLPLPYEDVAEGDWFYDAAYDLYQTGIMTGVSGDTFVPYAPITRASVVTLLYRLENEPESGVNTFDDVTSGIWYEEAVAWGAQNGVVKGFSDVVFGPDLQITREQLAAILYRYAGLKDCDTTARADLSRFPDADSVSGYAREAMRWAAANDLIRGRTSGALDPTGTATRAETAVILSRFINAFLNTQE